MTVTTMRTEWTAEEILHLAKQFFNLKQKDQNDFCINNCGVTSMTFRRWMEHFGIQKVITAEISYK